MAPAAPSKPSEKAKLRYVKACEACHSPGDSALVKKVMGVQANASYISTGQGEGGCPFNENALSSGLPGTKIVFAGLQKKF